MIRRLWFIWLMFAFVWGCSPAAKSLKASHSGQTSITASRDTTSEYAQLKQSVDSSHRDEIVRDTASKVVQVIHVVEVYDTTAIAENNSYPLSRRTMTIYNSEGSSARERRSSDKTLSSDRDSTVSKVSSSEDKSSQQSEITDTKTKSKRGNGFIAKLLIYLGLGVLILVVIRVLFAVFKPKLSSIVTMIKNYLKIK